MLDDSVKCSASCLHSAVFCIVCSYVQYLTMRRKHTLQLVSLCLPHLVEERTFSMGIVLDDLAAVLFVVCEFRVEGGTSI